jgi:hypothetical protein
MSIHDDALISADEIRAVLRAQEGPPSARVRPRRPRRPLLVPIGLAAVLLVGVAVLFGIRQGDDGARRGETAAGGDAGLLHVELPPLPPGPPRLEATGGSAAIERVTLDKMIARASVVFVGTVTDIGGIETLSVDEEGFALTGHRVRYRIDRLLRGERVDQVDLTNLTLGEALFPAVVGKRYLVFAELRPLGSPANRRLVPSGYSQGVYGVISEDRASNQANGTVSIDSIARRVGATEGR